MNIYSRNVIDFYTLQLLWLKNSKSQMYDINQSARRTPTPRKNYSKVNGCYTRHIALFSFAAHLKDSNGQHSIMSQPELAEWQDDQLDEGNDEWLEEWASDPKFTEEAWGR